MGEQGEQRAQGETKRLGDFGDWEKSFIYIPPVAPSPRHLITPHTPHPSQTSHPQIRGLTEQGNPDLATLQPFRVRVDNYNPIDRYHGEFEGLIKQ